MGSHMAPVTHMVLPAALTRIFLGMWEMSTIVDMLSLKKPQGHDFLLIFCKDPQLFLIMMHMMTKHKVDNFFNQP